MYIIVYIYIYILCVLLVFVVPISEDIDVFFMVLRSEDGWIWNVEMSFATDNTLERMESWNLWLEHTLRSFIKKLVELVACHPTLFLHVSTARNIGNTTSDFLGRRSHSQNIHVNGMNWSIRTHKRFQGSLVILGWNWKDLRIRYHVYLCHANPKTQPTLTLADWSGMILPWEIPSIQPRSYHFGLNIPFHYSSIV